MHKLISHLSEISHKKEQDTIKKTHILLSLVFKTFKTNKTSKTDIHKESKSDIPPAIKKALSALLTDKEYLFSISKQTVSQAQILSTLLFSASEHSQLDDFMSELSSAQKQAIITQTDSIGNTLLHFIFTYGDADTLKEHRYFNEFYSLYASSASSENVPHSTSILSTQDPLFLTALDHLNDSMFIYGLTHLTHNLKEAYKTYKTLYQRELNTSNSSFKQKRTLLSLCLTTPTHPIHDVPKTPCFLGLLFELSVEFKIEEYTQSCLKELPIPTPKTLNEACEETHTLNDDSYIISPLVVAAKAGRLDLMKTLLDLGHPVGYEYTSASLTDSATHIYRLCYNKDMPSSDMIVKHIFALAFDVTNVSNLDTFFSLLSDHIHNLPQDDTLIITQSIFLSLAYKSHNAATMLSSSNAAEFAVEMLENHEQFLLNFEPKLLTQTILDLRAYMIENNIPLLPISFSAVLNRLITNGICIELDDTYCDAFAETLQATVLYTHGYLNHLAPTDILDQNYTKIEHNRLYSCFFLDHVWPLCGDVTKHTILSKINSPSTTTQEADLKDSLSGYFSDHRSNIKPLLQCTAPPQLAMFEMPFPLLLEHHLRYCNTMSSLALFTSYVSNPTQKRFILLKKEVPMSTHHQELSERDKSRLTELCFMKQFFNHLYELKVFAHDLLKTIASQQTLIFPPAHQNFLDQLTSIINSHEPSSQKLEKLDLTFKNYLTKKTYALFKRSYSNSTTHSFMCSIFLKEIRLLSKQCKQAIPRPLSDEIHSQLSIGINVIRSLKRNPFTPIQRGAIINDDLDIRLHTYKGSLFITSRLNTSFEHYSGPLLIVYDKDHHIMTSVQKGTFSSSCSIGLPITKGKSTKGSILSDSHHQFPDYKIYQRDLSESNDSNFYTSFLTAPEESDDDPYDYASLQRNTSYSSDLIIQVALNEKGKNGYYVQCEGLSHTVFKDIKN